MWMGEAVEYAHSKEEEIDPLTTPVQEQIPAGEPIVALTLERMGSWLSSPGVLPTVR